MKENKIKAIFFDIDGTLLDFKTHSMSESVQKALVKLKENGIRIFIATGRHISEMEELKQYPSFDGYITLNGGYCFNEQKVYYKVPFTMEDRDEAIRISKEMKYPLALIDESQMTINFINDFVRRAAEYANVPLPVIQDPELLNNQDIYQIVLYAESEADVLIQSRLKNITFTRWNPDFIDIIPENISKRQGIVETCKAYGFDCKECMAFGDAGNDIEMLQTVGYGIAMGNANEEVKKCAKEVTLSVEEDGIVATLKKYYLI